MASAAMPASNLGHESEPLQADPAQVPLHVLELPIEIWGEIASFSPRQDVLNLRATSIALRAQADAAITSATLTGGLAVRAMASVGGFEHIRTLRLDAIDSASLLHLTTCLAAHPRTNLTIHVISSNGSLAAGLMVLNATSLAGLVLNSTHLTSEVVNALIGSPFPIQLIGFFSRFELAAASSIPTLTRLSSNSLRFDDEVAGLFSSHTALQFLALLGTLAFTSEGLRSIAAIRTLRTLCIYDADFMGSPIDTAAAQALATNTALQDLSIQTQTHPLSYDTFTALCDSETLIALAIAVCPGMYRFADMTSLEGLWINGRCHNSPALDIASALGIVSMPNLHTLEVDAVQFEGDALDVLLTGCPASTLRLEDIVLHPSQLTALLGNQNVNSLMLDGVVLSNEQIATLSRHPTLTCLIIDNVSYELRNLQTMR